MMTLYKLAIDGQVFLLSGLVLVIGTLFILDIVVLLLNRNLRKIFDYYHFIGAYIAVALAVCIFLAN